MSAARDSLGPTGEGVWASTSTPALEASSLQQDLHVADSWPEAQLRAQHHSQPGPCQEGPRLPQEIVGVLKAVVSAPILLD